MDVYTEGVNFSAKVMENDVKKSVAAQNDNAFDGFIKSYPTFGELLKFPERANLRVKIEPIFNSP